MNFFQQFHTDWAGLIQKYNTASAICGLFCFCFCLFLFLFLFLFCSILFYFVFLGGRRRNKLR